MLSLYDTIFLLFLILILWYKCALYSKNIYYILKNILQVLAQWNVLKSLGTVCVLLRTERELVCWGCLLWEVWAIKWNLEQVGGWGLWGEWMCWHRIFAFVLCICVVAFTGHWYSTSLFSVTHIYNYLDAMIFYLSKMLFPVHLIVHHCCMNSLFSKCFQGKADWIKVILIYAVWLGACCCWRFIKGWDSFRKWEWEASKRIHGERTIGTWRNSCHGRDVVFFF